MLSCLCAYLQLFSRLPLLNPTFSKRCFFQTKLCYLIIFLTFQKRRWINLTLDYHGRRHEVNVRGTEGSPRHESWDRWRTWDCSHKYSVHIFSNVARLLRTSAMIPITYYLRLNRRKYTKYATTTTSNKSTVY